MGNKCFGSKNQDQKSSQEMRAQQKEKQLQGITSSITFDKKEINQTSNDTLQSVQISSSQISLDDFNQNPKNLQKTNEQINLKEEPIKNLIKKQEIIQSATYEQQNQPLFENFENREHQQTTAKKNIDISIDQEIVPSQSSIVHIPSEFKQSLKQGQSALMQSQIQYEFQQPLPQQNEQVILNNSQSIQDDRDESFNVIKLESQNDIKDEDINILNKEIENENEFKNKERLSRIQTQQILVTNKKKKNLKRGTITQNDQQNQDELSNSQMTQIINAENDVISQGTVIQQFRNQQKQDDILSQGTQLIKQNDNFDDAASQNTTQIYQDQNSRQLFNTQNLEIPSLKQVDDTVSQGSYMIRKDIAFEDTVSQASYMIKKQPVNSNENKQVIDDTSSQNSFTLQKANKQYIEEFQSEAGVSYMVKVEKNQENHFQENDSMSQGTFIEQNQQDQINQQTEQFNYDEDEDTQKLMQKSYTQPIIINHQLQK